MNLTFNSASLSARRFSFTPLKRLYASGLMWLRLKCSPRIPSSKASPILTSIAQPPFQAQLLRQPVR